MNLEELTNLAIEAAKKAGKYISESLHDPNINVLRKEGNSLASSVVTEVDFKSQEIILSILAESQTTYDLGLLTEESQDDKSRFEKAYFWCIDPMDGTLPFTKQTEGFSVSIALISKEGIPVIGVVYDPVTDTLYHAIKGKGAYKNQQPWTITPSSTFHFIADQSFQKHPIYVEVIESMEALVKLHGYKELKRKEIGGAVMNALWVLEHAPACYFKLPKPQKGGGCSWDFAATACIFQEMGAHVSDTKGSPLPLNKKGMTYMNEKGVLYTSNHELAEALLLLLEGLSA
ncbi:3'(2'),5'-bisphosphate nucleotidase CysQ family protein [Algivirga pacifica]|uniref:Inositol monophosphatase family protein n=1 Tax=Algivirga pacifica TaxID=1162670 RepID=A0ABP9D9J2_9BACT